MYPTNDNDRRGSEADRTSQTRFGPRPVPGGHHVPKASQQSRRVIASGRMSPDGRSAYPTPAMGTKIAVWGGIALGVAGGTAAAVFAVRKIAEAISDDPRPSHGQRPMSAPRFVQMDEDEREMMRRRVRAQDREDRKEFARLRAEASQNRPVPKFQKTSKGNFVDDLIQTSTKLSASLDGVAKSLGTAIESFRSVARQATEIMAEFAATADQLKAALRGEQPVAARRSEPDTDDFDRTHRL
ncbi:hypothetical protein EYF88_11035 [Paracoccus sediminis]|uniref:Uncharacterized protein n=1 Tax=Paracoccus sediminis TaxID=1214787 RepID=A0A238XBI2_9RHOB|nr:hypothetical protein [Paracoccus sediminis]TBN49597.1 hypothetical protein EYF88_11035 [Paracoccus sediminis]SNR56060.1 hypothetical protein SAMN06265378_10925 [Paracoccus sediminis]